MGLVQLPEIEDYWKQNPFFHYAPIADRIPRDRFRDISRYLHFCDNSTLAKRGQQGYDRLGKVRPVLNAIKASIMDNYQPSRDIVVDEAMIPFQGQSSLKQYLPNKPVKRGIKVWCLADSTNGYVQNFNVYTGKGSNSSEGTLGSRVVLMLSDHLKHKNHHMYCDNFFTLPSLFKELLERGTYACGTVRQNGKGFPSDLKVWQREKSWSKAWSSQQRRCNSKATGTTGSYFLARQQGCSCAVNQCATRCYGHDKTYTERWYKVGGQLPSGNHSIQ